MNEEKTPKLGYGRDRAIPRSRPRVSRSGDGLKPDGMGGFPTGGAKSKKKKATKRGKK